jgi:septal ring factor EnvC (AmiA/AmiB activator)
MRVLLSVAAVASVSAETTYANPIRRVVNMLQGLQTKIEEEAKTAEKLFDKFQCYCQGNEKKLSASIDAASEAILRLESAVEAGKAAKTQTTAELKAHKEEREAAKNAIEEATSMREKEHSEFVAESGDLKANINALDQAIPAIEKGAAGSFLQTGEGAKISKIAEVSMQLTDGQKSDLQAFLQGSSEYAPASGQIVGILKTMKEEMVANLDEITKAENEGAAAHNGMLAAKNSEISAATVAIEEKTERAGDLAVQVVVDKNDLKETNEQKAADEEFLAGLKADCEKTAKDQEEAKKARATELVALADTIKMLNSDEALELFKKTLPSPSLLQVRDTEKQLRRGAMAVLRGKGYRADLVLMALQGRKQGQEVIDGMIDGMVDSLKKEEMDDEEKAAYCAKEIQKAEDEGKEVGGAVATLETRIETMEQSIANIKSEIKELTAGVKDLDKAVEQATEQRKEEHAAYVEEAANNNAALDLLGMAKNRLAKQYDPKLYVAPAEPEMSEEDKIEQAYSFVQVSDKPDAAPETMGHSNSDAGGVVALMANIIKDLKKEMQENEFGEKDAQEDYERFIADSKKKRAEDTSAKSEKEGALADAEAEMLEHKGEKNDRDAEFRANREYLSKLHADCDWNVENLEARKQARVEEVGSLKKGREVLHGADLSLLQVASKPASLLSKSREQSCSAADLEHRQMIQSKFALLQGICEDMCRTVGAHPDCRVCEGFVPPPSPGVLDWDGLYAQFDKLKLVGRDMIKEWTGDAGKFGR